MFKVINLGNTVPETGEPRVKLLDNSLVKTASNDIQNYWDSITDTETYAYVWVIGVSAHEYYGCNNNGDSFKEEVLKDRMNTFLSNAHIFLHHVNKDPKKSLGKPVFVFYNEDMHRVELILAIERNNSLAQDTLGKLKSNSTQLYVSMGANVPYDECSICGNKAKNRMEYCNHLKYNMKKILPNGTQVFAYNPSPTFFDISFVSKPADSTAFALDKVASQNDESLVIPSAYLGELSSNYQQKLAALDKLSDIIKKVEGTPVEGKDEDGNFNIPFTLKDDLPVLDYPSADFDTLEKCQVSPGGLLRISISQGALPSFGEVAYASGKHHFGDSLTKDIVHQILQALPGAISMLRRTPERMEPLALNVLGDYNNDMENSSVLNAIAPIARERVILIKQAGFMSGEEGSKHIGRSNFNADLPLAFGAQNMSQHGPAHTTQYNVADGTGKQFVTDRRSILQAKGANSPIRSAGKLAGGVLAAAAIGAILAEPELAKKFLLGGVLSAGSAAAFSMGKEQKEDALITQEGEKIPANTMFHVKDKGLKKESSWQNIKPHLGTLAGMAVPAALGLDYLYTRKYQYPGHPDPGMEMGIMQRYKHRLGEKVKDNPATSLVSGAIGGAVASPALRRLIRKI